MAKRSLKLPVGPIPDLLKWWKKAGVEGIIIGGLAVAIHTRARSTQDIDAVILLDESGWEKFLSTGKSFSFEGRYDNTLAFARESRVFLLRHAPTDTRIDLSIGALPFEEEALRRAIRVKYGRLSIPIATVEDLMIMKAVAGRDQDRMDIIRIIQDFENLDLEYIRGHLKNFATILDTPEVLTTVEHLLATSKRKGR